MKKIFTLSIAFFAAVLFTGCAHTNELASYDVNGSKIFIKEVVSSSARSIKVQKYQELPNNNSYKNQKQSLTISDLVDVSSNVLSSAKQKKLREKINTSEILNAITIHLKDAMHTYLEIEPVNNLSDEPDFICTIRLNQCQLLIDKVHLEIYVSSSASLIDRSTGELVWKNSESKRIPLQKNYGSASKDKAISTVINALQLAALDEDEINEIVDAAADDVGNYMAETLRDDVADAHKERNKKKNSNK